MEFQGLVDQYGFAAIGIALVAAICYFIIRKLPSLLSRGLDILQAHLKEMSAAWTAHKDALEESSERARQEHSELLKAFHAGQTELIKFLQEQHTLIREQLHTHDKDTMNLHNRVDAALAELPHQQTRKDKNKENPQ